MRESLLEESPVMDKDKEDLSLEPCAVFTKMIEALDELEITWEFLGSLQDPSGD